MHYEEQTTEVDLESSSRQVTVTFNTTGSPDHIDPGSIVDSITKNKPALPTWEAEKFIRDAKRRIDDSNLSILNGNKALYQVLAECYEQANQMAGDTDRREAFDRCWKDTFKRPFPDAPYFSAVIKLIVGDAKKQSAYIMVLKAAKSEKVTYEAFVTWVTNKGGLEKIRLENSGEGLGRAERLNQRINEGLKALESLPPLLKDVKVDRPNAGKRVWVIVCRLEADDTVSQVWNCTDSSVLDKVQEVAGKKFGTAGDQRSSEEKMRDAIKTAVESTPDE